MGKAVRILIGGWCCEATLFLLILKPHDINFVQKIKLPRNTNHNIIVMDILITQNIQEIFSFLSYVTGDKMPFWELSTNFSDYTKLFSGSTERTCVPRKVFLSCW